MRNCDACGGSVKFVNGHIAKCEYCGRIFQVNGDNLSEVNMENLYKEALGLLKKDSEEDTLSAVEIFDALGSYKDSSNKAYEGKNKISKARADEADRKLEEQRQNELAEIERKKREYEERQKKKITAIIGTVAIAVIAIIVSMIAVSNSKKNDKYQKAVALLNQGEYEGAVELFENIGDYKDSVECLQTAQDSIKNDKYQKAVALLNQGEYESAVELFEDLGDYKDSVECLQTAQDNIAIRDDVYSKGISYYNEGLYSETINVLTQIAGYLDSNEYIGNAAEKLYEQGEQLFAGEDYEKAREVLSEIPENSGSYTKAVALLNQVDDRIVEIQNAQKYESAVSTYENGELEKAQKYFMEIRDYSDSLDYLNKIGESFLSTATDLFNAGDYVSCGDYLLLIDTTEEWSRYSEAVDLFNQAKEIYYKQTAEEAKNICRSQGETEMRSFINGRKCSLLSDDSISTLAQECRINTVSMETLEAYTEGAFGLGHEYSEEDTLGNTYAYAFHGYMSINDGGAYEVFYINSEYKYLNATVAVAKPWDHIDEDYVGHIRIYGDDRLLWSDDNIKGTTKPYDIQVDIEGVEDLKIEMYGAGNGGWNGIHVLLCNPILSE